VGNGWGDAKPCLAVKKKSGKGNVIALQEKNEKKVNGRRAADVPGEGNFPTLAKKSIPDKKSNNQIAVDVKEGGKGGHAPRDEVTGKEQALGNERKKANGKRVNLTRKNLTLMGVRGKN